MVTDNQVTTLIFANTLVNANERIELEFLRQEVARLKSYKGSVINMSLISK